MDAGTFPLTADPALLTTPTPPRIDKTGDLEKARQTAIEFESFFLGQMLQPLFASLGAEEPFGGGSSEDMWRTMQVDEYGKAIARAGGIGIADAVFNEILKLQEVK